MSLQYDESTPMIGEWLGHDRIGSKLGEGGIGVVYKALDTRLARPVAIKVLPAGKQILFDRIRENSDIVLIELERQ